MPGEHDVLTPEEERARPVPAPPGRMAHPRERLREAEEMMEDYQWQPVTEDEERQNASYLASASAFGNRMLLEVMTSRLGSAPKPKDKNGQYGAVMEKMGAVTAAYSEQVSAENFAERYSRMLVRYSELKAVCDRYARTQEETKPSFFDRFRSAQSKKDDAQRLTQIEQIGQIAIQDMSVIRTYGVRMAKSTKGISWKELFVSQGRLERINQSYAEKAKAEGAGAEKASFSDQIRQAYLRRHPEEREDTGRPATVESLAGELKELRGKFSALQELLDKLMKPGEKSGGKVEEPSGETSPQPLQPSVEPSLDAPKTGPVTPTQGVVQ